VKRGDVYWVNFEPAQGGEIRKQRPALIVSNDAANQALNRLQVIPLTSNTGRLYPSEALVRVNGVPHKAMADQIRTIAKERLRNYVGAVPDQDMDGVEVALRRQLGLR
jgi:mRNA interferase MazF